jgi:hypothetical protein
MKKTANIATYPPRLESLRHVLFSIYDQFDVIRIYFNEYDEYPSLVDPDNKIEKFKGENLTDNGKFYALDLIKEDEYFFTLDDDLIYPEDYVKKTIKNIEDFRMIVSYHGRQLKGLHLDYYRGHKSYHCLAAVDGDYKIDVCGTGVTAFDTRYFKPKGLAFNKRKKMSDLIFSLAATKKGKILGVMKHKNGWFKYLDHKETIFMTESKNTVKQNEIADEIFTLNYLNGQPPQAI